MLKRAWLLVSALWFSMILAGKLPDNVDDMVMLIATMPLWLGGGLYLCGRYVIGR